MIEASEDSERTDFLYFATAGAGVMAPGAAVCPLVNQMNPSADVRAQAKISVDISYLAPGTLLTVSWLGKPIFIRHRTEAEMAQAPADTVYPLPDSSARNLNPPPPMRSQVTRTGPLSVTRPIWLRSAAARLWAVSPWVMAPANSEDSSAPVTARITMPLGLFAKARRLKPAYSGLFTLGRDGGDTGVTHMNDNPQWQRSKPEQVSIFLWLA